MTEIDIDTRLAQLDAVAAEGPDEAVVAAVAEWLAEDEHDEDEVTA